VCEICRRTEQREQNELSEPRTLSRFTAGTSRGSAALVKDNSARGAQTSPYGLNLLQRLGGAGLDGLGDPFHASEHTSDRPIRPRQVFVAKLHGFPCTPLKVPAGLGGVVDTVPESNQQLASNRDQVLEN
jgi:hypothetical protein